MNILTSVFDFYQEIDIKLYDKTNTGVLMGIVDSCCLGIHYKNTRSLDIGILLQYTFIRDIMVFLAEKLTSPHKEIFIPLTKAMKSYVWFEQAKLMHIQEGPDKVLVDICDVLGLRKEIRMLYHSIMQGIIVNKEYIHDSEMIMILFEISQKRAMRDFFMESNRIQEFFD
jgi:hypothetical protein